MDAETFMAIQEFDRLADRRRMMERELSDGPEEREFDSEEHYRAVMEQIEIDENEVTMEPGPFIPMRCVVQGHDFHPVKRYCRRCGLDQDEKL